MTEFLQFVVGGIAMGAIFGLVALGFVVLFKSTGIFNFAQGDLVMVGAFASYWFMASAGVSLWPAIALTLLFATALGWFLQQALFRPMLGSSLLTMVMVTIALSLIFRALVVIIFGPTEKSVPERLPSGVLNVFGLVLSVLDLTIIAVAVVSIALLAAFFRFTDAGLQLRAIGEHPHAAAVVGINTNGMYTVAMVISTVTAALGGILLANLHTVSPNLAEVGILAFPAAVLGGMRSIPGAVVGGLIIGLTSNLATGYVGGLEANVVVYVVLLLVLLVKPAGLLGSREVTRV